VAEAPSPLSYGRRVAALAAEHPEAVALVFAPLEGQDRPVTWQELEAGSNQLARLLDRAGAQESSLVAVALPNSPEHVACCLAAWKLGACVLPLRHDLPGWEQERLLAVAGPSLVVGQAPHRGPGAFLAASELGAAAGLDDSPLPERVPDPAMAIATSGSSGAAKLIVAAERGEWEPDARPGATAEYMGARPHQVQLVPAPLYHTNGFKIAFSSLFSDDTVVLMERFEAGRAVDLIERYRVTTVTMVPTMLQRIARLPGIGSRDLSSLESVLQGGAPCPEWLARAWIELVGATRFFCAYGSSERVGLAIIRGDEWLKRPGSVGRPADAEVRILDPDGGVLGPGEVGEIFMRPIEAGPRFSYRGGERPRATQDGFVSVGDLGWLDPDGYLYVADRRADMIVTGGANVYPAEVEAALSEHPEVADVVVVGVADPEWGRRVCALVQPRRPDQPPSPVELVGHCRQRLASYKVPKSVQLVDRLPRNEAGKLNRGAIAAALEASRPPG
jgi:bile acid-coenzyme A ligase